ncbi:MAG: HAMP domain-containing histidine kinase [Turicibacter sp.]|nr:HAMP domain-containing histidine kinase [Turicibacter sp.]
MFGRIKSNLRFSILAVFSALLFLSFLSVGLAFNVMVRQYINVSAGNILDEARITSYNIIIQQTFPGMPVLRFVMGNRQEYFRSNLRSILIDSNYNMVSPPASVSSEIVVAGLAERNLNLENLENTRLQVDDSTFFISASGINFGSIPAYSVFYIDVTDLQNFVSSINTLLIFLALLIWLIAVTAISFLSSTLTKPLRILQNCALRIGRGDFTQNSHSFLNEEFEALNKSLNHAAKQLATYDNDQKIFFQNASHELRTPMMTIKSYAEGIKYGIMDKDKAAQIILDASSRLSEMIDDILYISKIDNLTMDAKESCDLRILVQERIGLQQPLAELKELEIKFMHDKTPVFVHCAVSYVNRAIDNLMANALRFAKKEITVECYSKANNAIIIVKDDGPGFEPDDLPRVFERFFMGKEGITGIGLAIVKSIADQHKGNVTAENDSPGAKLTVNIPLLQK